MNNKIYSRREEDASGQFHRPGAKPEIDSLFVAVSKVKKSSRAGRPLTGGGITGGPQDNPVSTIPRTFIGYCR